MQDIVLLLYGSSRLLYKGLSLNFGMTLEHLHAVGITVALARH